MHMADALIAPAVAVTMYTASAVTAGISVKKVQADEEIKKIPLMGVMGAFVFSAQMINFTIPGTGASGHLAGGIMLAAILGPYAGFLTLACVLVIQCLMFADGGLLALGCNIWNMAFFGCIVGGLFILGPIFRNGITRKKIIAASMIGSILSLQMGAFSVVLQTSVSEVTELSFFPFLFLMQPIHLAIGIVEGLITSAVLCFIYEARPELIWKGTAKEGQQGLSFKGISIAFAAGSALLAGVVSLFASADPDGLEWSIQNIVGTAETETSGIWYIVSEKLQSLTTMFPDYGLPGSNSAAVTGLSGVLGAALVFAACFVFFRLMKSIRRKRIHQ